MIGNKWRVYINPFDDNGVYTGYQEVTADVDFDQLGSIAQNLDNTEYNIGVYRNANVDITLRNDRGIYSDVGNSQSIFKYTRANSLVKITWEIDVNSSVCGFMTAGVSTLSQETTVFVGLINDDSLTMDLDSQEVTFTLMGRESLLNNAVFPTTVGTPNISTLIYNCLNQTVITNLLTVSVPNINVGTDAVVDTPSVYVNKTVAQVLADLLLVSNSVLYISNDAIIVSPRTATAAVQSTYYGQASKNGVENIQDIKSIASGLVRVFNYLSWQNNSNASQNSTSITKYGVRQKQLSIGSITNTTVQTTLMDAIVAEFALPKQEFDLYTPLNYDSLARNLLDRISVDYPTVLIPINGHNVPICGLAICGVDFTPGALWSFTVDPSDNYKVIGKELDIKNALVKLKMRLI